MKIHLAAGCTYLEGYINADISGFVISHDNPKEAYYTDSKSTVYPDKILLYPDNPNKTDINHYFKDEWQPDSDKRKLNKRPFIIDKQMNILKIWSFEDNSVDELVLISAWEHFWPQQIKEHLIPEVCRVLKPRGKFIVDFPDVIRTVDEYRNREEEMMILLYCNHASEYAIHHFGYTENTFKKLWPKTYEIKRNDIVKHDYPMIGMEVVKN